MNATRVVGIVLIPVAGGLGLKKRDRHDDGTRLLGKRRLQIDG